MTEFFMTVNISSYNPLQYVCYNVVYKSEIVIRIRPR